MLVRCFFAGWQPLLSLVCCTSFGDLGVISAQGFEDVGGGGRVHIWVCMCVLVCRMLGGGVHIWVYMCVLVCRMLGGGGGVHIWVYMCVLVCRMWGWGWSAHLGVHVCACVQDVGVGVECTSGCTCVCRMLGLAWLQLPCWPSSLVTSLAQWQGPMTTRALPSSACFWPTICGSRQSRQAPSTGAPSAPSPTFTWLVSTKLLLHCQSALSYFYIVSQH